MFVFRADRLFDGERILGGDHAVVVEEELICAVTPWEAWQGSAPVRDLRGYLVMPGLVNAHTHIPRAGWFEPNEALGLTQPALNLRESLAAGVTTMGDMGCTTPLIRSLRELVDRDPLAGPSIRASGPIVTAPGGYPLDWMPTHLRGMGAAAACADERAAARAVDRIAHAGMNHVKLAIMHRSYSDQPLPALREPVARAAVVEAHRQGLRAVAHAHSAADYRVALAAGVDALMHSSFEPLSDDLVEAIADSGVSVCPTLWVFESTCLAAEMDLLGDPRWSSRVTRGVRKSWRRFLEAWEESGDVVPPGIAGGIGKERARDGIRVAAANLKLLIDRGVPIGFGNDANYGFSLLGRPVDELTCLQRAGLSSTACLRAATSGAAALLGVSDRGRLAAGQRADVIAVDPRAAEEVAHLESVAHVWHRGREVELPDRSLARAAARRAAYVRGVARTAVEAIGQALTRPRPGQ